ncbi:MAG: hypothetical protein JST80_12065 [Bdellovibrionales bacterium]|nr:hypothetical protein [Bdellovibrionales bacterium]
MNTIIHAFIDGLVLFGKELLLPIMTIFFFGGLFSRAVLYFTVKRQEWFVKEFEKRAHRWLENENGHAKFSYFVSMKTLLEKTFYELFEIRNSMRRRKTDNIMAPSDRIFLIQQGCAYMVRDTLKQSKVLKKENTDDSMLLGVSKNVLSNNPCFSKMFGVIQSGPIFDFTSILPGLFVVGGIFGTFLGIMKALPELGGMDVNDPNSTKAVMDTFLLKVAFSMATSTLGILYSVLTQVFNSFFNPEKLFVGVVERYQDTMSFLWKHSDNNEIPANLPAFDEHKNPNEALAALSVQKQVAEGDAKRGHDQRRDPVVPPVKEVTMSFEKKQGEDKKAS